MKLKNTLGLVISAMILSGCAQAPLEHRAPFKVVDVNMPAKQAYEKLIAHPYCGSLFVVRGQYTKSDNSFIVRFNSSGFFEYPADIVEGEAVGANKTRLVMRSVSKWQTPISQKTLTRLQTGRCE